MENPIIELQDVSLRFKTGLEIFNHVNLQIPKESFYFLTGPSGSGKSTFLRLLYRDCLPIEGNVTVGGQNILTLKQDEIAVFRRKVGVIFQDFRLVPHLNAIENVALPLKAQGVRQRKREQLAFELLQWVGLERCIYSLPSMLSGGQQQRVAIARSVVAKPMVILADEPTGNVDDYVAKRLMFLFEELHRSGTTVIVATHNQYLANEFPYPQMHLHNKKIIHRHPKEHVQEPPHA